MTRDEALTVGRPPGTSPGWMVWHQPSGLQALSGAVRYKKDAQNALAELLALDIDWTEKNPLGWGTRAYKLARPVYVKYGRLRQKQIADSVYDWPRPKEVSR